MANGQLSDVLRQIHKLAAGRGGDVVSDGQLLERFAARNDQAAFEALVGRHGRLVLGVCRRVLGDAHEAEDAFQAAFLVLARKAASLGRRGSLGGWLYTVAYRLALKAKEDVGRRLRGSPVPARPVRDPLAELTGRELLAALDEELQRLPEKLRTPLVLCCLEGRTRDEAARALGWTAGAVKGRLERGRERLRRRLAQRGLPLSAALLPALVHGQAPAALPPPLAAATARAAAALAAGPEGAASASPGAVALAHGALQVSSTTRVKVALALLLALGVTGVGAGLFASRPATHPAKEAADADAGSAPGARAREPRHDPAPFARGLWVVTDLVLKHHISPPARGEMILAGTQALLKAGGAEPPAGLRDRVKALKTVEEFEAFLRDLWPGAGGKPPDQLEAAMLQGLLRRVPGEPNFLAEDYVRQMDQVSANRYVGIGIQIALDEKEQRPKLVTPFRRGPAHRAGARPGDLIHQVDGRDTQGAGLMKVVEWLRGEEGTAVTVVVGQPGAAQTRTLRMTRGVVPIDSVHGYRRQGEDGWRYRVDPAGPVAYVRVNALTSSTLHELRQAERQLRAEGARAVVLDLRFCTGGALHPAELVAGGLLDGGLMWRVQDARGGVREYRAEREGLFRGWPMAVLVNEFTSGAAPQAVAAALQDNGRAVLVGERARGDGHVTSIVHVPGGQGAIPLYTGRLERAAGAARGWPLRPDHPVAVTEAQRAAIEKWLREKALSEVPPGDASRPPEDPQLARAVELLRAAIDAEGRRDVRPSERR
jgi:C-terminal peptidase prc